jgi:malate dehydrogenase
MERPPIRISVTGAAGHLAYALLFRIASGDLLGPRQRVELMLFDLPHTRKTMRGVQMELQDCAFPLLTGVTATDDPTLAFTGAQLAFMVGARARSGGMERGAVLADNARIFAVHGAALGQFADPDCKTLVVGNPCNTNTCVALHAAQRFGRLRARGFTALMRLDHNRALGQLARKTGVPLGRIRRVVAWGNHSAAVCAEERFATVDGRTLAAYIHDPAWRESGFISSVASRPAAVMAACGHYAEASAASAAIDQMRDWCFGTGGDWTTMGVPSEGDYGVPAGLVFGMPVTVADDDYRIVQGLAIDEVARARIESNVRELEAELAVVKALLPEVFA